MTVKEWLPEQYMDEATPPGRASPDDWVTTAGDVHALEIPQELRDHCDPIILRPGRKYGFYWLLRFREGKFHET